MNMTVSTTVNFWTYGFSPKKEEVVWIYFKSGIIDKCLRNVWTCTKTLYYVDDNWTYRAYTKVNKNRNLH